MMKHSLQPIGPRVCSSHSVRLSSFMSLYRILYILTSGLAKRNMYSSTGKLSVNAYGCEHAMYAVPLSC
jgi:hypothetical protein